MAERLAAVRARRDAPTDTRLAAGCGSKPVPEPRYLSPVVGAFLR